MPPVSEKQKRAMYAAAAGKSKLGIPAKVGREFVHPKQSHPAAAKGFRRRAKEGYA